jgi:hypothetical protein
MSAQELGERFEKTVKPFLTKNCLACHNTSMKAGQLDLMGLRDARAALEERDVWESAAVRMKTGQMPPAAAARPDPKDVAEVVGWMERQVESIDGKRRVDPGRVTARRLNRNEYNNTIRDLLDVAYRPAEDFPIDDSGYGFDNIGDVLSLSPTLMEKYVKAATEVSKMAVWTGGIPKPMFDRYDLDRVGQALRVPADPEGERINRRGAVFARHRFPMDAEYEIRVLARGRIIEGHAPEKLVIVIGGKQHDVVDVEHAVNTKRIFEYRVKMRAGDHEIGAGYISPGPDRGSAPDTGLMVDSVEVKGPYTAAGELPESHKRLFVCKPAGTGFDEGCARLIIGRLAMRAWRRPVSGAEVDKLTRMARMVVADGESFEKGIQVALKAVLVSPQFLFRIEKDPDPNDASRQHKISDWELATRLSYFLWSSMPDEELFRLAGEGKLSERSVLQGQVRRMLADGKADALAEHFAGQWLELRNLATATPDTKKFANFDGDLREAMKRETVLFFTEVMRADRSILDFIDGKFTYLNERLAGHYGIKGVEGRKFRRVELDGTQRSGVLTQASVLTVTSYPARTSPVLRGLWVLENFLGTPPPVPPANVPQLKEEEIGKSMTLRQQLERHRADPSCAVCHNKMDVLGFGLENYDPVGSWRDKDGNFPVDAAGVLPGNKAFGTPAELKVILRQDQELFTHMFVEKMLTYALGRGLESYDRPVIRAIGKNVSNGENRFGAVVTGIVSSAPFQMRRGDEGRGGSYRKR